ncbi:hypothetical protein EBU71_17405, partial [bacterium]|nr:hypothetical protein [Candidatus Elulimicrobium humile]
MTTIARIYSAPNFGGTQYTFTTSDLDQKKSFATTGITLTLSTPMSIIVEPGYQVELRTSNNKQAVYKDISYYWATFVSTQNQQNPNQHSYVFSYVDGPNVYTHFYIRKIPTIARIYDNVNYTGTEYILTESDLDIKKSISTFSFFTPMSMKIETGYAVEFYTNTTNLQTIFGDISGSGSNGQINFAGANANGQVYSHIKVRKILAKINAGNAGNAYICDVSPGFYLDGSMKFSDQAGAGLSSTNFTLINTGVYIDTVDVNSDILERYSPGTHNIDNWNIVSLTAYIPETYVIPSNKNKFITRIFPHFALDPETTYYVECLAGFSSSGEDASPTSGIPITGKNLLSVNQLVEQSGGGYGWTGYGTLSGGIIISYNSSTNRFSLEGPVDPDFGQMYINVDGNNPFMTTLGFTPGSWSATFTATNAPNFSFAGQTIVTTLTSGTYSIYELQNAIQNAYSSYPTLGMTVDIVNGSSFKIYSNKYPNLEYGYNTDSYWFEMLSSSGSDTSTFLGEESTSYIFVSDNGSFAYVNPEGYTINPVTP